MGRVMDPARSVIAALPKEIVDACAHTQRIPALIRQAVQDKGWTVPQLVHEATRDLNGARNIGALVTKRLAQCADRPPAASPTLTGLRRTHNDCCEHGWVYDEATDPPTTTKCLGVPV